LLKKSAIVNSGFQGAQATDGGTIQLIDTSISGSPDVGALAWSGGVIGTDGGTISGNGGGIGANAGTVRVHATHITGNNRFGVQAYDGGRVTLLGPQIDSNHGPGVNLLLNSSASIGGTITKNDGVGVALSGGSMADVGSASISGNGGAYDVQCFGPLSGIAAQVPPGLTTNCQNG
jgi:hypothetical protein